MKTASVKKNYILNTILQIVLILIPIITTPYVSRVLGVNKVGEYSYAAAMATYFTLFATLGTGSFGQRQIAYTRDDKDNLSNSFWNVFLFRCVTSIVALVFYFIYLIASGNLNLACFALSLNIVNVIFDLTWFYHGIEDFKHVVFKNLLIKSISLVLIFLLVKKPEDVGIYSLIISSSSILGSLSIWFSLKKHIHFVKKGLKPFKYSKDIILIFLPTIAIQIYTVLDKTMIGWITSSSYANGCYDKAEQISRIALTVVTSIAAVILPRVSNLFNNKRIEEAKEYVYKAYRFVWFLSIPICLGLIIVAPTFIPLFLGDGYDDAIHLLQIFSLLTIFVSVSYVTGLSYLVSTKQQNVYTIAVSAAAIINLVMNILLIPRLSATGAAIASVTAEFVGCAIQLSYCIFTKQLDPKKIFGPSVKYLFSGAIMFVCCFGIDQFQLGLVLKLCLIIAVGVFSYFVSLIFLKDKLLLRELGALVNKIVPSQQLGTISLQKERDLRLDFIKGVCIILVVFGHTFPLSRSFVYLFHIPLFFMVSGFLFSNKRVNSFKEYVSLVFRRIKQLYLPFIAFGILFVLLHNLFIDIGIYTNNSEFLTLSSNAVYSQTLKNYYTTSDLAKKTISVLALQVTEELLTASWFLTILLLVYFIDGFLRFLARNAIKETKHLLSYLLIVCFVNFALLFLTPLVKEIQLSSIWLSISSILIKVNIGYFLFSLGSIIKLVNFKCLYENIAVSFFTFLFSFVFLCGMSHFGTLEISAGKIVNPLFLLFSSVSGWIMISSLYKLFSKNVSKPIIYVGKNTLCIVFLHVLSFKLISFLYLILSKENMVLLASFHILFTGKWYMSLAYTIVGVSLPLLINLPYKRFKKIIVKSIRDFR